MCKLGRHGSLNPTPHSLWATIHIVSNLTEVMPCSDLELKGSVAIQHVLTNVTLRNILLFVLSCFHANMNMVTFSCELQPGQDLFCRRWSFLRTLACIDHLLKLVLQVASLIVLGFERKNDRSLVGFFSGRAQVRCHLHLVRCCALLCESEADLGEQLVLSVSIGLHRRHQTPFENFLHEGMGFNGKVLHLLDGCRSPWPGNADNGANRPKGNRNETKAAPRHRGRSNLRDLIGQEFVHLGSRIPSHGPLESDADTPGG